MTPQQSKDFEAAKVLITDHFGMSCVPIIGAVQKMLNLSVHEAALFAVEHFDIIWICFGHDDAGDSCAHIKIDGSGLVKL